ncbi:hypothetical protein NK983_27845, partial [Salmonella enterica subsp. enterica serovar Typhimurium]|nr:hypothetical protein [Salmonella enterica subsp. enterica serovar Typhimurium]
MADDVARWCESRQMFGRTVTVKAKFADFRQVTRSRTLPAAVTDPAVLRAVSVDLVRSLYPLTIGIRLVGVTVSNFVPVEVAGAMPLFGDELR